MSSLLSGLCCVLFLTAKFSFYAILTFNVYLCNDLHAYVCCYVSVKYAQSLSSLQQCISAKCSHGMDIMKCSVNSVIHTPQST